MLEVNPWVRKVKPSPTFAVAARAAELKAQGRNIVGFTLGEPDFDTPQHVKDAANAAMKKGLTKYTVTEGILPLREAVCAKLKRDQGYDYTPKEIIITNGGKQALTSALQVLIRPGEEAIFSSPYWTSYPDMVSLVGGEPVIVPTRPEGGYLMTAEALERACTPKTRVIMLNSPSNPTGAAYNKDELRALANCISAIAKRQEVYVLSDEVYEYFAYDGFTPASLLQVAPELRDRTVVINAFSKAYSMTGWRVGYAAGPKEIIGPMGIVQSQVTSNVCSIAQWAAAAAYDDNGAFPRTMLAEFNKRLDLVCDMVKEMKGIDLSVRPRGAFYAFLRIDGLIGKRSGEFTIQCAEDFTNYLLEKYDVAVVHGEAFGDDRAIRTSFASDVKVIRDGFSRIGEAAASLT